MKEKYLQKIKRAMLLRFTSKEIRDTLEDISSYYDSALKNGIAEEQIIRDYGSPKEVVEALQDEERNRTKEKRVVFFERILLFVCAAGIIAACMVLPMEWAVNISVVLASLLIWFVSGANCSIENAGTARKKRKAFFVVQVVLFAAYCIIQLWAGVICPQLFQRDLRMWQIDMLSQGLMLGIFLFCIFFLVITVYSLVKLIKGNKYFFFCVVQGIALTSGMLLYYDYLKIVDDIEYMRYIFVTYIVGLVVLIPYWIYLYRIRGVKDGLTA